jgi:hypothetical protein
VRITKKFEIRKSIDLICILFCFFWFCYKKVASGIRKCPKRQVMYKIVVRVMRERECVCVCACSYSGIAS